MIVQFCFKKESFFKDTFSEIFTIKENVWDLLKNNPVWGGIWGLGGATNKTRQAINWSLLKLGDSWECIVIFYLCICLKFSKKKLKKKDNEVIDLKFSQEEFPGS